MQAARAVLSRVELLGVTEKESGLLDLATPLSKHHQAPEFEIPRLRRLWTRYRHESARGSRHLRLGTSDTSALLDTPAHTCPSLARPSTQASPRCSTRRNCLRPPRQAAWPPPARREARGGGKEAERLDLRRNRWLLISAERPLACLLPASPHTALPAPTPPLFLLVPALCASSPTPQPTTLLFQRMSRHLKHVIVNG